MFCCMGTGVEQDTGVLIHIFLVHVVSCLYFC